MQAGHARRAGRGRRMGPAAGPAHPNPAAAAATAAACWLSTDAAPSEGPPAHLPRKRHPPHPHCPPQLASCRLLAPAGRGRGRAGLLVGGSETAPACKQRHTRHGVGPAGGAAAAAVLPCPWGLPAVAAACQGASLPAAGCQGNLPLPAAAARAGRAAARAPSPMPAGPAPAGCRAAAAAPAAAHGHGPAVSRVAASAPRPGWLKAEGRAQSADTPLPRCPAAAAGSLLAARRRALRCRPAPAALLLRTRARALNLDPPLAPLPAAAAAAWRAAAPPTARPWLSAAPAAARGAPPQPAPPLPPPADRRLPPARGRAPPPHRPRAAPEWWAGSAAAWWRAAPAQAAGWQPCSPWVAGGRPPAVGRRVPQRVATPPAPAGQQGGVGEQGVRAACGPAGGADGRRRSRGQRSSARGVASARRTAHRPP